MPSTGSGRPTEKSHRARCSRYHQTNRRHCCSLPGSLPLCPRADQCLVRRPTATAGARSLPAAAATVRPSTTSPSEWTILTNSGRLVRPAVITRTSPSRISWCSTNTEWPGETARNCRRFRNYILPFDIRRVRGLRSRRRVGGLRGVVFASVRFAGNVIYNLRIARNQPAVQLE